MARRSRDWNEGLAQDLWDEEFARAFLLAAMDEGVPIQHALGKVIRAMGVKEFAEKVQMAAPKRPPRDSSAAQPDAGHVEPVAQARSAFG